jgi:hypothetical protein
MKVVFVTLFQFHTFHLFEGNLSFCYFAAYCSLCLRHSVLFGNEYQSIPNGKIVWVVQHWQLHPHHLGVVTGAIAGHGVATAVCNS